MQPADYGQALAAARRWIAEHGRCPQQQEWEHRAPDRPTTRTIKRRWGWEELTRAAGGRAWAGLEAEARKARRLALLFALRLAREELARGGGVGEGDG
ncbi:MAG: hypothetical protein DLM67_00815 [Candidatus Nephthysia bennettiae]|uniref:Uncharacterized protein n=1 Tax=Candidatus Nephthysia bennettiae TaxID=3127016 RepID=A0A934N2D7_9BACT|nr:hypothetical protein [Candidatus Dormibacteraeota bacterium]PZS00691.1 MAG: hypothetical protein DLM67_00815 [Candidatus Dormibacteraeota bacterium]